MSVMGLQISILAQNVNLDLFYHKDKEKYRHLKKFTSVADIVGVIGALVLHPVAKIVAVAILANIAIAKRVDKGNGMIYYMGVLPLHTGVIVWIKKQ